MTKMFNYNDGKKLAIIGLKVKANARSSKIEDFILIDGKFYLKLAVKAAPENGKANEAIITFLSKEWQIIKHNLEIISGKTNSVKLLAIKNIDPSYLNSLLSHYIK